MITDPLFYAAALPAVALTGLSKGGFGGAFGFAAVPLLALVISPVQAAGMMLPILLVMDVVAVIAYRRIFDRGIVLALLPAGLVGTGLGWATASLVSDDAVRVLVGLIALAFLGRLWRDQRRRAALARVEPVRAGVVAAMPAGPAVPGTAAFTGAETPLPAGKHRRPGRADLWGTLSGYTSFVAHAGGPPFQTYVVPLGLTPVLYAGTSAIFFAIINAAKVVPYAALGQFHLENLSTAAALAPLAIASTMAGVRVARVINQQIFYRVLIVSVLFVAIKLIHDGLSGLTS